MVSVDSHAPQALLRVDDQEGRRVPDDCPVTSLLLPPLDVHTTVASWWV